MSRSRASSLSRSSCIVLALISARVASPSAWIALVIAQVFCAPSQRTASMLRLIVPILLSQRLFIPYFLQFPISSDYIFILLLRSSALLLGLLVSFLTHQSLNLRDYLLGIHLAWLLIGIFTYMSFIFFTGFQCLTQWTCVFYFEEICRCAE